MIANKVICGDCAEVMVTWEAGCIDLTVTSPPYDQLRDYEGYTFDFEAIAAQLWRVTKPGGVIVWVVGDATIKGSETGTSFRQALHFMELGFNLHDTMIYQKKNPVPLTHNRYEQFFEYMFVFSKGSPNIFNPIKEVCIASGTIKSYKYVCGNTQENASVRSGMNRSVKIKTTKITANIWSFKIGKNQTTLDDFAFEHPAMFPEKLARDHILSWSNPGDLVLDPMCGSGTVAKMAKQTGRNYIGIDISENYCELARKRALYAQPPLFEANP